MIGRCQIDLSTLEREKSHKIEAALEDNAGIVVMHLAITGLDAPGCESDLNTFTEKPGKREEIAKQFTLKNTGKKIKEVGWLQVHVKYQDKMKKKLKLFLFSYTCIFLMLYWLLCSQLRKFCVHRRL